MHTCDSSAAAKFPAGTYLEREMLGACCNCQVTRSCRRRSIQAGRDCCMVLSHVSCSISACQNWTGGHHLLHWTFRSHIRCGSILAHTSRGCGLPRSCCLHIAVNVMAQSMAMLLSGDCQDQGLSKDAVNLLA